MAICATAASADAPVVAGWWSLTSLGPGGVTPPDVPADGLFVQNLPSGAAAVSALEFRLPAQASSATSITLQITGAPIITQPPIMCAATSRFAAAQSGAWSDRPSWDCSLAIVGVVDAAQSRIQFGVDPLVEGSTLSVVVLAGGPVDRIPLQRPDFETLTQVSSDTEPAVDTDTPPPITPAEPFSADPDLFDVPAFPGSALPEVTSTTQTTQAVEHAAPVAATPRTVPQTSNGALGTAVLLLALLGIMYWSDGFGLVPLRSLRVLPRTGTSPPTDA
jgi:hypothetical protein